MRCRVCKIALRDLTACATARREFAHAVDRERAVAHPTILCWSLLGCAQALVGSDDIWRGPCRKIIDHDLELSALDGSADRLIDLDCFGLVILVLRHRGERAAQDVAALR